MKLSQSAVFALDLATRRDGYLSQGSEVIDELRREGLVTTQNIGDGFMIVKAIPKPSRNYRNRRWIWPEQRPSA